MSDQEMSDMMPDDYVTKREFELFSTNIEEKVDDIKTAVGDALKRMEQNKDAISDNSAEIGLIKRGIQNGEKYADKTSTNIKWLIMAAIGLTGLLVGGLSNIGPIVKLLRGG